MIHAIVRGVLFFVLAASTACQPMTGNGLLTDKVTNSSSTVLNKDPRSEELFLKSYSPSLSVRSSQTKVDLAGECFVSTFPGHKIQVWEGAAQVSIVDINSSTGLGNSAQCIDGKFNLVINTSTMTVSSHSLRVELIAYDSAGQPVVNQAQGVSFITLTKSN